MKMIVINFIFLFAAASVSAETKKIHPKTAVGVTEKAGYTRSVSSFRSLPAQTVKISGLKAVMLAGEVDGLNGKSTKSYTDNLKQLAKVLKERNVKVVEIYAPTTEEKIKTELKDANFVFYAGHGIGGADPPSYVASGSNGGMLILENVWTGAENVKEWEVKKGAIVFFMGACFTAGNAGDDIGKINAEEAKRRIAQYSEPYLNSRFGGYYAAWSPYELQEVIGNLFAGKTLGESYGGKDSEYGKVNKISHPKSSGNSLWFYEEKGGRKAFSFSFAGNPKETLTTLFSSSSDDKKPVSENNDDPKPLDAAQNVKLIKAIYKGDDEAAFKSINDGADPNAKHKEWSALLLAAHFNREHIAKRLIQRKADINYELNGWSSLRIAEKHNYTRIADALKSAGAKATSRFIRGINPVPEIAPAP